MTFKRYAIYDRLSQNVSVSRYCVCCPWHSTLKSTSSNRWNQFRALGSHGWDNKVFFFKKKKFSNPSYKLHFTDTKLDIFNTVQSSWHDKEIKSTRWDTQEKRGTFTKIAKEISEILADEIQLDKIFLSNRTIKNDLEFASSIVTWLKYDQQKANLNRTIDLVEIKSSFS